LHTRSRRLLAGLFCFAAILALLALPAAADKSPGTDGLAAPDIIKRVQAVYAGSRSYLDSGMVKEVFIDANGERIVEKPFTTAFVRPHRFRYEFRETPAYQAERRFVIHQEGEALRVHWDLEHELELNTLDRAIAAATGVSSESAITVPGMLLPGEITWRRAIRFRIPTRIADDMLGNIDCYRILDRVPGGLVTFWIGKQDLLLRKTYMEQSFDDFRVQRTTSYEPAMNIDIDTRLLRFDPPAKKPWWRF